jgi:hypothetical protein
MAALGVTSTALPSALAAASPEAIPTATGVLWLRWTITERRGAANSIQVAELDLRSGAVEVPKNAAATVTNPGGSNPGAEGSEKVFDGLEATKWLDFAFAATGTAVLGASVLLIGFTAPVTFDAYRWWTANDSDERDPIAWRLEVSSAASPGEQDWREVDRRGPIPDSIPTGRTTATEWFGLSSA